MNPRRHHYSLKEDLSSVRTFILITFWLSSPIWFWLLRALPPKFSVELVGSRGFLDAALPEQSDAPISTAFNVTLHAANRRLHDVCYRHGEAAVRYSGFTVAWGRTRAFCMGKKEARAVPVVAWADGLAMPRSLRERLAADLRAGAVELEVDVRLFRGDDGSARPTLLSCKVKAGGARRPPGVTTPCTVFALQNWASDIAPAWMVSRLSLVYMERDMNPIVRVEWEVPFLLAREDGVSLPEHLRDHMAAARKAGALELEVQVRLFQGGDATSPGRPTRMWCKTRMGGGAQPPDLTACTVLALQNWFDIDNAD
ncbi:hypothetical protein HU200_046296 [Digitaria exilis]|uniref:Uncharacterized protein n=1 Tax=Digitaria exilis TaxID=1010633 RepID=A0A835AZ50_9POAL|nr:hypothetical protein HU200_046296 [Digitaria exilis]